MMQQADCVRNNWIVGAIFGLVVLLFVSGLGDLHWLAGVFLGAVTFLLLGGFLVWLADGGVSEPFDTDAGLIEAAQARAGLAATQSPTAPEPAEQAPAAPAAVVAEPAPAPAQTQTQTQPEAAPRKAAAASGKSKAKPKAKRDDLTKITGIGPKTAELLVAQGVTQFGDIAAWDDAAIADHAARLGRLGARIAADDWVGQARKLTEAGRG